AHLDKGSLFACEWSSHYWFEYYPASEGPAAVLLAADMLRSSDKVLSELVDELKKDYTMKHYIDIGNHEVKSRVVQKFRETYPDAEDAFDGIKIHLSDGEWVMVRESQTNPEVGLVVEGRNEERMNELLEEFKEKVEEFR
ncbi:MAG: hypothetical protein GOU97_02045, partial [Nanoarchaeota archaeon]|nr:hypothetical protein [Nanoarchaeota archaeon]